MKKLVFFLLLFTGMVKAQIVNIPDANFKNRLVNTLCVDTNNDGTFDTDVDSNNDGEIQISEALEVSKLNISGFYNNILIPPTLQIFNMLGIESFTNLQYLNCSGNILQNLNLNNNSNLLFLNCSSNLLTVLDLSSNINLISLECSSNQILSLDVSQLTNLNSLSFSNNLISSINLTNLINIISLQFSENQFSEINLSGLINLQFVEFASNPISNINFEGLNSLFYVNCSNTLISNLDFSENLLFDHLQCDENPNLISINLKNGIQQNPAYITWNNNPNLRFICADLNEMQAINYLLATFNLANVILNNYCSFTPGGLYNTITGTTKLDQSLNGCDLSDPIISNLKIRITDGTNSGITFSNIAGDFKFYTQAGSFDITPEVENPSFFNFTPTTATIPFANNNNNIATQDFCISANGIHPDLEVVIAPITPARPGFDATYELVYKNKGNQTLNGFVSLNYDVLRLLFISSNTTPDFNFEGTIDWNFTNLLPFESRSISLTLNVNSPIETPAVNIGDVLNFTTSITPIAGDEMPTDNTFTYNQTVVGSFDPNDITCLEGESVAPSEIGEYLHYVINFENTGNFPAENIVVKTIVDPIKFDINSLQLLNTSNPVDARITGNVVEFIFEDIQLAGPGGHGHVLLKVKSKSTLVTGDNVAKSAGIYFDYNAPVDTGMATTVFQSLSNAVFEKDTSINVSPNPTNGNININSNFNIKSIALYDLQGRVLQTILNANKLDISEKANGIYYLKITTEKGSKIEKIIKE